MHEQSIENKPCVVKYTVIWGEICRTVGYSVTVPYQCAHKSWINNKKKKETEKGTRVPSFDSVFIFDLQETMPAA